MNALTVVMTMISWSVYIIVIAGMVMFLIIAIATVANAPLAIPIVAPMMAALATPLTIMNAEVVPRIAPSAPRMIDTSNFFKILHTSAIN